MQSVSKPIFLVLNVGTFWDGGKNLILPTRKECCCLAVAVCKSRQRRVLEDASDLPVYYANMNLTGVMHQHSITSSR